METFALNISLVQSLNEWANSSLYFSNLIIFAAVYLGWLMLAFLYLSIFCGRGKRRAARLALLSTLAGLLALLISDLIKTFYPVERPFDAVSGVSALFWPGDISSFPSSHASFFGGLAIFLSFRDWRSGRWYLFSAVLVGLARIAGGVHFPLDIVAGFTLAGICAAVINNIFRAH